MAGTCKEYSIFIFYSCEPLSILTQWNDITCIHLSNAFNASASVARKNQINLSNCHSPDIYFPEHALEKTHLITRALKMKT